MKRNLLIIVLIVIALFFGIRFFSGNSGSLKLSQGNTQPTITRSDIPKVTLIIDDGSSIATYSGTQADNAFAALIAVGNKENIGIKTEQYDFGVFVQSIAGKENGKDKAWIYFVNGKSGEVAADKMKVNEGDTIEWKYTTPIY